LTREFIMTPEFDKIWSKMGLTDDNLKELQEIILSNPQIGSVIEGTGGLRKVRFALNEGKSGGIRVLYIDLVVHEQVYLISAFSKGNKDNLTKSEKNEIKKVIDQLKKSVDDRGSI